MTDTFSPEPFTVPDEQMGLWDSAPPEPPDLWDEPPVDEWIPPEPPDAESPAVSEPLAAPTTVVEEPFAPPSVPLEEPEYTPSNTWERYLASFTPEQNPDIREGEERNRAQALNLMDARFVGVEYQNEAGEPTGYGIGCIEVYADPTREDDVTGRYLDIAAFDNPLDAVALYDTLQTPVEKGWIADYGVHELANFAAGEHDAPDIWREATPDDLAIYDWYTGHDLAFEPPMKTNLAHQQEVAAPSEQSNPAFNALSAIGIQSRRLRSLPRPTAVLRPGDRNRLLDRHLPARSGRPHQLRCQCPVARTQP